ncbi:hypothetical protein [Mesomycoplasma conjunctivae]|uniref:hypothetical protein n=1 Tax=Mesomycoplasma conjunctivae TaxID=45361 RepID=UPI003DA5D9CD
MKKRNKILLSSIVPLALPIALVSCREITLDSIDDIKSFENLKELTKNIPNFRELVNDTIKEVKENPEFKDSPYYKKLKIILEKLDEKTPDFDLKKAIESEKLFEKYINAG